MMEIDMQRVSAETDKVIKLGQDSGLSPYEWCVVLSAASMVLQKHFKLKVKVNVDVSKNDSNALNS